MKINTSLSQERVFRKRARFLVLLLVIPMVLSACGSQEKKSISPQDIVIQYQADDGEYDENMILDTFDKIGTEEETKEEKTIITLAYAGNDSTTDQMDFWVTAFNEENREYYVEHTPYSWDKMEDARRTLNIEVGTGKGPDIMTGDVFPVDIEMLDSGMLVNLESFLVASGMTDDKYYPSYKAYESENKVYGISPNVQAFIMCVDAKVLGNYEVPEMETLIEKLLEYPEKACFLPYWDEYQVLQYFLMGSEDVWGMVDWESKECNFTEELFSGILEVAKRYGENSENGYEPVMSLIRPAPFGYEGRKSMEAQGKVIINYYFDDGNFPMCSTAQTFFVNSNTKEFEGAWAFLSYVMSKKGQNLNYYLSPVHKEISHEILKKEYKDIEEGKLLLSTEDGQEIKYELADDADVLLAEIENIYNTGRYVPTKAEMIQYIIYEEVGSYFAGDKGKEEVIDVIESRVNLYLSELK